MKNMRGPTALYVGYRAISVKIQQNRASGSPAKHHRKHSQSRCYHANVRVYALVQAIQTSMHRLNTAKHFLPRNRKPSSTSGTDLGPSEPPHKCTLLIPHLPRSSSPLRFRHVSFRPQPVPAFLRIQRARAH